MIALALTDAFYYVHRFLLWSAQVSAVVYQRLVVCNGLYCGLQCYLRFARVPTVVCILSGGLHLFLLWFALVSTVVCIGSYCGLHWFLLWCAMVCYGSY